MPFTPFHAGPHLTIALILQKYVDVPVFVAANIVLDLEPLAVMLGRLDYPLHGYLHTFLFGGMAGLGWGLLAYRFSRPLALLMEKIKLPYTSGLAKTVLSGITGAWLHVVFDASIYGEMRPFFPLSINPFYGLIDMVTMYRLCFFFFLPAGLLYLMRRRA